MFVTLDNMARALKSRSKLVSSGEARSHFGQILRRAETGNRPVLVSRRGVPKAVILGIQEYIRLKAPQPEILRVIGEESKRRGTDKITAREIDALIQEVRREKRVRNAPPPARS